jgi:hypothetical protein
LVSLAGRGLLDKRVDRLGLALWIHLVGNPDLHRDPSDLEHGDRPHPRWWKTFGVCMRRLRVGYRRLPHGTLGGLRAFRGGDSWGPWTDRDLRTGPRRAATRERHGMGGQSLARSSGSLDMATDCARTAARHAVVSRDNHAFPCVERQHRYGSRLQDGISSLLDSVADSAGVPCRIIAATGRLSSRTSSAPAAVSGRSPGAVTARACAPRLHALLTRLIHDPIQPGDRHVVDLPNTGPSGDVQGRAVIATERAVGHALRRRYGDHCHLRAVGT